MKKNKVILIYVFVCLIVSGKGWGRGDLEKYGPMQLALRSSLIKCNHDRTLNLEVSNIDVYFYDFSKNEVERYPINEAGVGILSYKHLDKSKQFIVFVGGFKSHINKKVVDKIRDTFREYPNSYLIIPDHSTYTNDKLGNRKSYARSVQYVYYIGRELGKMMVKLLEGGVSSQNIHCIGHSLGAQMLAHVGEVFFNITNEKIKRITALDPAGPCFSNSFIHNQVRSGVAEYVEVYHCNAGALGSSSVLGDVDFFVNKKGQSQPNCGTPLIPGFFDSSKAAKCSHRTCIDIWTASVKNKDWFPASKCNSYKDFSKGWCGKNDMTIAGFWNPGTATGVYYFSTEGYVLN